MTWDRAIQKALWGLATDGTELAFILVGKG